MTKSLDLQTIPGEINEEIFIITALLYTYNNNIIFIMKILVMKCY